MDRELVFVRAGFGADALPYEQALQMQRELHARRVGAEIPDTCLLLEHQSVYTAGRRTSPLDRPIGDPGAPVIEVDRGGKITWHGPGQLVGYPILALDEPIDVISYVRLIEEALIRTCSDFGLPTTRMPGRSGVWILADQDGQIAAGRDGGAPADQDSQISVGRDGGMPAGLDRRISADPDSGFPVGTGGGMPVGQDRKVAAIGIRVARGVTMHGFALNCDNDLSWFDRIVPCGIRDATVTSLSAETGRSVSVQAVLDLVERHLAEVLGADLVRQVDRRTSV